MKTSNECVRELLREFVLHEIDKDNEVPLSFLDCFSEPFVVLRAKGPPAVESSEKTEAFIRRFEMYIHSRQINTKDEHEFPCTFQIESSTERWLSLSNKLKQMQNEKTKLFTSILATQKQMFELKTRFRSYIDEHSHYERDWTYLLTIRLRMLQIKAQSTPLAAVPHLLRALMQLKSILQSELKDCRKILSEKSELLCRYNEVKDNPEFHELLAKYDNLLQRQKHLQRSLNQ